MQSAVWNTAAEPVDDPVGAMRELAGRLRHAVDTLGVRLEDVGMDSATAVAWARAAKELRQTLGDMERLGIAERHVQLEQVKVRMVASAFGKALDNLGLSAPELRTQATRDFIAELRAQEPAELPAAGGG